VSIAVSGRVLTQRGKLGALAVASSRRLLSPKGLNIYEIDFHEEVASVKRFFGFPSSQKPASP